MVRAGVGGTNPNIRNIKSVNRFVQMYAASAADTSMCAPVPVRRAWPTAASAVGAAKMPAARSEIRPAA